MRHKACHKAVNPPYETIIFYLRFIKYFLNIVSFLLLCGHTKNKLIKLTT